MNYEPDLLCVVRVSQKSHRMEHNVEQTSNNDTVVGVSSTREDIRGKPIFLSPFRVLCVGYSTNMFSTFSKTVDVFEF